MLAKVATEKSIMQFGIEHDQTEADFSGHRLGPVDVILIASDLAVSSGLTKSKHFWGSHCGPLICETEHDLDSSFVLGVLCGGGRGTGALQHSLDEQLHPPAPIRV